MGDTIWWRVEFWNDIASVINSAHFDRDDPKAFMSSLVEFVTKYMAELMSESLVEQYNWFGTFPRPIVQKRIAEIER